MLILGSFGLIGLAALVVLVMGQWKVFQKADEAGWKCLIPIYNEYVLACIATRDKRLRMATLVCSIACAVCYVGLMSGTGVLSNAMLTSSTNDALEGMNMLGGMADLAGAAMMIAATVGYAVKVIVNYKLAQAFDQSRSFGILLSVAGPLAMLALAFDSDIEYLDPMD